MICEEARELIGGDPETETPELLEHLSTCPECQAYRAQMIALNAKIRRALELDPEKLRRPGAPIARVGSATGAAQPVAGGAGPAAAAGPGASPSSSGPRAAPTPTPRSNVTPLPRRAPTPVAKHKRPRLFAFAASLAAALVAGFTLWLSRPNESLAAELVAHVEGEPNSWSETQPVTVEHLEAVLRKSGVKLGTGMQPVVYASSCWFRGHFVPHFVVMTKDGPVTVMILANEQVRAAEQFKEDGFSGLLVPARTGSVAVISRTPMALEQPAREVVTALTAAPRE